MTATELHSIVERDLIIFDFQEIPRQILDRLSNYKVIMLGEVHYIKEYPHFLAKLATELHKVSNFNTLLIESPQAFNWIVEDYTLGLMPEIENEIADKFIYSLTGLRDIRKHNLKHYDNKLKVHSIDINHTKDYFIWSLKFMQNYVEAEIIRELVNDCNKINYMSYTSMLNKYKAILKRDYSKFDNGLDESWYQRLLTMIDVEIFSNECRNYILENQIERRYIERENYLKDLIDAYLRDSNGGVLINMGAFHIQKVPIGEFNFERVGEYLSKKSTYAKNNTYCINFVYAKGTYRNGEFNVADTSLDNCLSKIIANYTKDSIGFLSFDDILFTEKSIIFMQKNNLSLAPKTVFDGLIMLPHATYNEYYKDFYIQ